MDNATKIKDELDVLCTEYKNNKSQLSVEKTKRVSNLLIELTYCKDSDVSDVAFQLSRFSADVAKMYFESITIIRKAPIELIDEVLKALISTIKDPSRSQFYVKKFVYAVIAITKNYTDKALDSNKLPFIVAFVASFALRSLKNKAQMMKLVNNTDGKIYLLDYSKTDKFQIESIWKITNNIYPELESNRIKALIADWAVKYGFNTTEKSEKPQVKENITSQNSEHSPQEDKQAPVSTAKPIAPDSSSQKSLPQEEKTQSIEAVKTTNDDKISESENAKALPAMNNITTSDKAENKQDNVAEVMAKKLYNRIRRDMSNEKDSLISAFADMLKPVNKAFESVQGEISKSRVLGAENVVLKRQTEELKQQLAETRSQLQSANQSLIAEKENNKELKNQITDLENKKSDLDQKLNEAYTINSRESSLEAEKVRSELKKAFAFLYEDWLEYEFSDVSEENYESLQAIIKKTFRALERNGIDFKGEK